MGPIQARSADASEEGLTNRVARCRVEKDRSLQMELQQEAVPGCGLECGRNSDDASAAGDREMEKGLCTHRFQ